MEVRDRQFGRLTLLRIAIVLLAGVLLARLWQIQMVTGEKYRLLADRNRLRDVDVPAPRGVIYDRNGEILARNRPSFTVVIVPGDIPEDEEGEPEAAATRSSSTGCSPSWTGPLAPRANPPPLRRPPARRRLRPARRPRRTPQP